MINILKITYFESNYLLSLSSANMNAQLCCFSKQRLHLHRIYFWAWERVVNATTHEN